LRFRHLTSPLLVVIYREVRITYSLPFIVLTFN
jgi:hypothetical protein